MKYLPYPLPLLARVALYELGAEAIYYRRVGNISEEMKRLVAIDALLASLRECHGVSWPGAPRHGVGNGFQKFLKATKNPAGCGLE
jgi:hypothetical protein